MTKTGPVRLALMGAGARGELNLGWLARKHPGEMRFVAVAERDAERRDKFVQDFGVAKDSAFEDWEELLARPPVADALVIALPCRLHYAATVAALRAGYDVLLEKPMAHSAGESAHLARVAQEQGRILAVALQCRYNRIYSEVKAALDADRIGRLMNIDCAENIGYWHFIMSYVRGMHSYSPTSHSFLLAKGIHDTDLLNWFAGSRAVRVSSFGRLSFFTEENAPPGAPKRCTDGCPVQETCEFDAVKQYLRPGRPSIPLSLFRGMSLRAVLDYCSQPRFRTLASTVVRDISEASVMKALQEGPHGRCVFHSDNDVVDHQTVHIEYENEVTVSFSLSAFSLIWERTCNFHGTQGEIRTDDFSGHFETRTFNPARVRKRRIPYHGLFHGGGDEALLVEFAKAVRRGNSDGMLTRVESALDSHLVGFAAEEARRTNEIVDMAVFRQRAQDAATALATGAA